MGVANSLVGRFSCKHTKKAFALIALRKRSPAEIYACMCALCVRRTSPRGSGPHTLVLRGEASGCCKSAGGPGSRCRSWCCRGTRKSRGSRLRSWAEGETRCWRVHVEELELDPVGPASCDRRGHARHQEVKRGFVARVAPNLHQKNNN